MLQGKLRVRTCSAVGPSSPCCSARCMCCPDVTLLGSLDKAQIFCLLSVFRTCCAAHSMCCMVKASLSSLDKCRSSFWCLVSAFATFLRCSLHVLRSRKPKQSGQSRKPHRRVVKEKGCLKQLPE